MKIITILILFVICYNCSFAQPGPPPETGGGLSIKSFYDSSLNKISIDNPSLSININGVKVLKKALEEDAFFITPYNNDFDYQKLIHLDINYNGENHKIDIQNIFEDRFYGSLEEIDSIVLDRPYILSKRQKLGRCWDNPHYVYSSSLLKNGITPYTNKILNKLGFTHFSPDYIDNAKQLPWEEYFCKAANEYSPNHSVNEKSLTYLEQALKENNNEYNEHILNLKLIILSDNIKEETENSQSILDLIDNNTGIPLNPRLEDLRALCLINLKRYEEAVAEYEKLEVSYASLEEHKEHYTYEKMKVFFYQKKYQEIIKNIPSFIKATKNKHFLNITYRGGTFDQMNKWYFLYSFCSYLEKPTAVNKRKLIASLHNSEVFYQDYDFIRYLLTDFYMNTPITKEKFQGFKLLLKMSEKENLF